MSDSTAAAMAGTGRTGRRRGDPDTRGTVLAAAREVFSEVGFERATMRGIAQRAGVDPALIHHYFGTKVGLFAAVGELPVDPSAVLAGLGDDPASIGHEIALRVLTLYDTNTEIRRTAIALVRSAVSHADAADGLRDLLTGSVLAALRGVVTDDTAELRAALIGSHVAGLILARYVLRLPGIADADVPSLAAAVGPALQHYAVGALG